MARSKTATVQLKLRLREDLRRRIEQEAKKVGHSLNQEMVNRLTQSFRQANADDVLIYARALLEWTTRLHADAKGYAFDPDALRLASVDLFRGIAPREDKK